MKLFVLFFAIICGITTSDLVGLSPDEWQYWVNVFTMSVLGSAAVFIDGWIK